MADDILDTAKRVLDLADKADRTPLMVNRHDTVAGAIGWQLQQDGGHGEVVGEMIDLDIPKAKGTAHFLAAVHRDGPALAEWVRKVDEVTASFRATFVRAEAYWQGANVDFHREAHNSIRTIDAIRSQLGLSELKPEWTIGPLPKEATP